MTTTLSLNRLAIMALACGAISLVGVQAARAGAHHGVEQDSAVHAQIGEEHEVNEAQAQFLEDTRDLRKEMMVKRTELRALMRGDNPDPDLAAALAGELFDLREQVRTMALEAGIPPRAIMDRMGRACGMKGVRGHHMLPPGHPPIPPEEPVETKDS